MRFSTALLVALPVVAMASPLLVERCTDESSNIAAALAKTDNDIKALNTTLAGDSKTNKPTAAQEIALLNAANTLEADINQTTSYCQMSCQATSAQSTAAFNYLSNTILPDTLSLLNNFIAHKPAFKKAGVDSIIKSKVSNEKTLVDQLGACFVKIGQGPSLKGAAALQKKFDAAFTKAINAYSS